MSVVWMAWTCSSNCQLLDLIPFSKHFLVLKTVKNTSHKSGWDRHDLQTSASPFEFD